MNEDLRKALLDAERELMKKKKKEKKSNILEGVSDDKLELILEIVRYTYFPIDDDYILYLKSLNIKELERMLEQLKEWNYRRSFREAHW